MEIKIKTVKAGYKGSKNYNSVEVSFEADVNGADHKLVASELVDKAREIVNTKLELENNKTMIDEKIDSMKETDIAPPLGKEEEIGASWLDKKDSGKLNCKDSKTEKWRKIKIDDMEVIDVNTRKHEGIIFRKIPEKERKSSKMPIYRMYREAES